MYSLNEDHVISLSFADIAESKDDNGSDYDIEYITNVDIPYSEVTYYLNNLDIDGDATEL